MNHCKELCRAAYFSRSSYAFKFPYNGNERIIRLWRVEFSLGQFCWSKFCKGPYSACFGLTHLLLCCCCCCCCCYYYYYYYFGPRWNWNFSQELPNSQLQCHAHLCLTPTFSIGTHINAISLLFVFCTNKTHQQVFVNFI